MNLFDEQWVEEISGIGASSDSFYEYLLKAHILFGGEEYLKIFDESYNAIVEWIMDSQGFLYKNVNMRTGHLSTPWIDSLAAFFPGLQVLYGMQCIYNLILKAMLKWQLNHIFYIIVYGNDTAPFQSDSILKQKIPQLNHIH
jgi:hypothetical protein